MMDKRQLRNLIRRVLIGIGGYSEEAENLLMGTAAQESALGEYIRQLGNGPALGIFQMEPETFDDIVRNYLSYRPDLCRKVLIVSGVINLKSEYLEYNMATGNQHGPDALRPGSGKDSLGPDGMDGVLETVLQYPARQRYGRGIRV